MYIDNVLKYFFLLLASFVLNTLAAHRICYYNGWSLYEKDGLAPEDIPPHMCSHIIFAYATVDDLGTTCVIEDKYLDLNLLRRFDELRKSSEDLVMMLGVGGWGHNSNSFHKVVQNEETMTRFSKNCIAYVRSFGYDGLEIDWQFPGSRGGGPDDNVNFYKFLRVLNWEILHEIQPDDKSALVLSASIDPRPHEASKYYWNLVKMSKYVNWFSFMVSDLHGIWDSPMLARHHSALISQTDLLNVNNLARYWVKHGIPRHKVVLVLSIKGRSYTLADPSKYKPGSYAIGRGGDGGDGYKISEICKMIRGGHKERYDSESGVPYLVRGSEWIGYENPTSLKRKAEIVGQNRLGGVALLTIDTDDHVGACGLKYPMMNAIIDGMGSRRQYKTEIREGKVDKENYDKMIRDKRQSRQAGWDAADKEEGIYHVV